MSDKQGAVNIDCRTIADYLNADLEGNNFDICAPASLDSVRPGSVVFIAGSDLPGAPGAYSGCLLIVPRDFVPIGESLVRTDNPQKSFANVIRKFFSQPETMGVDPLARIGERVRLGKQVSIGAYSIIDNGARIGDDCRIGCHVHIHAGVNIGSSTHIGSGTVIGEPGFGFIKEGDWYGDRFPHVGGVQIGNHVRIGANVTIARSSIDDTVIAHDCRIDDQVYIAHNTRIGENTIVCSGVRVNGSVDIGRRCWLGSGAIIRDQLCIHDQVTVGMGAVVVKSLTRPGTVYGNPAQYRPAGADSGKAQ